MDYPLDKTTSELFVEGKVRERFLIVAASRRCLLSQLWPT